MTIPINILITGAIWGIGLGFPSGILLVTTLWLHLGRQPRTITSDLPNPDDEQYIETQPSLRPVPVVRHTSAEDALAERSTEVPVYPFKETEEKTYDPSFSNRHHTNSPYDCR